MALSAPMALAHAQHKLANQQRRSTETANGAAAPESSR